MKPETELAPKLTPENSAFGRKTVIERWPVIMAQIIDSLYRHRVYFSDSLGIPAEALKSLTGSICQLRYEVTTNKPVTLLHTDLINQEELEIWNRHLQAEGVRLKHCDNAKEFTNEPSWHGLPWLFTECYLYRRIMDCVALTGLASFDPFSLKKQSGLKQCQSLVHRMLNALDNLPSDPNQARSRSLFDAFVYTALWANEFDLSLHLDVSINISGTLSEYIESLHKYMVINNIHDLYGIWSERLRDRQSDDTKKPHTVAIVLDNSGPELVADFCLAEYLIHSGFTTRVVFYPKVIPWYVSDVTTNDITWILNEGLSSKFLDDQPLIPLATKWAERWRSRFDIGQFIMRESPFWTYAYSYEEMAVVDPKLHEQLTTGTDVILFKGDLNYRKLVADRAWRPDSVRHKQAAFRKLQFGRPIDPSGQLTCRCFPATAAGDPLDCRCPMPVSKIWPPLICALRIAKADVAVGLNSETLMRVQAESSDWWVIGRYGIIQIVSPIQM